ncbi:MAG: DVUA0089 family protein [Paracoccaceae bacterium]
MEKLKFIAVSAAACLLPMAGLAQGVCGVASANIVGGGLSNIDLSTADAPTQTMAMLSGTGPVVYQFDVSSPTEIRVEASDSDGADPVVVLLNAAGVEIAGDDDGGGGRSSRVETFVQPGTYCAQVNAYGSQAGSSLLQFSRVDQPALTPGVDFGPVETGACTADTPAELLTTGSVNAALAGGGSVSVSHPGTPTYLRFTLDTATAITLTAVNPDADPVLRIYDNSGVLIAENDDANNSLNSQIDQQEPLAAGTYCIALASYSDSTAPITVTMSEFDPAAFLNGRYDRAEAAPPIGGDYPVQEIGSLSTSLSSDIFVGPKAIWVTFTLPEASMVVLEAIGNGQVDPVVTLFNERGTQIGYNDDGPTSYDSQLAMELQAGRYLFAITQFNADGSGVVRAFLQRYIRAQ